MHHALTVEDLGVEVCGKWAVANTRHALKWPGKHKHHLLGQTNVVVHRHVESIVVGRYFDGRKPLKEDESDGP